ncbi:EamA-like transporter family protein [Lachnospiraceae bacterium XBD2001]|nr:EamA-like transporter family protein [Lachnospiraceae bacterium XBD2001]
MNRSNWKVYIALHVMLMVYSMSGICSKMAAGQKFLSLPFLLLYGMVIALLGFYAICWQQILKRIPLTTAFANKAVTVVWGLVWGVLIFHEYITVGKIVGILFVVMGIVVYALSDQEDSHES